MVLTVQLVVPGMCSETQKIVFLSPLLFLLLFHSSLLFFFLFFSGSAWVGLDKVGYEGVRSGFGKVAWFGGKARIGALVMEWGMVVRPKWRGSVRGWIGWIVADTG